MGYNLFMKFFDLISSIFYSIIRTTVRFWKNLPHSFANFFKRKINEYKRRPERTEINKVYVLVGYTTKKHVDSKYNAERNMIIIRRGLMLIILLLLIFIAINRIMPLININEYSQMFGVNSVDEITENDPFN